MSIASVAAQQSAATAAANAAAAGLTPSGAAAPAAAAASGGSSAPNTALSSLSGNFSDFLGMLMTQLKNQDPSSPMDSNQFTSELVQFSSVEQQINTNSSLTQLIQLTQGTELMQGSDMVGKQVTVQSDHVPLQNGSGTVTFTSPATEPAAIAVYNDAGQKIRDAAVTATKGQNAWSWDGTDNNGNSVPDGSYKVAVIGVGASGKASALPFDVVGTATGVQKSGTAIQLNIGALSTDFSTVQSVGSAGQSTAGQSTAGQ